MPQEKICVRQYQEYPGSTVWRDYAIRCPNCLQLCTEYGEVDALVDEEWHSLCLACGEKALAQEKEEGTWTCT